MDTNPIPSFELFAGQGSSTRTQRPHLAPSSIKFADDLAKFGELRRMVGLLVEKRGIAENAHVLQAAQDTFLVDSETSLPFHLHVAPRMSFCSQYGSACCGVSETWRIWSMRCGRSFSTLPVYGAAEPAPSFVNAVQTAITDQGSLFIFCAVFMEKGNAGPRRRPSMNSTTENSSSNLFSSGVPVRTKA